MKIVFQNIEFTCVESPVSPIHSHKSKGRDWRSFHIAGDYNDITSAFIGNATYSQEWESETEDENGEATTETITQDMSEYSIAGDIVDLRDGTFMVYMGKPTETETLIDELVLAALGGE